MQAPQGKHSHSKQQSTRKQQSKRHNTQRADERETYTRGTDGEGQSTLQSCAPPVRTPRIRPGKTVTHMTTAKTADRQQCTGRYLLLVCDVTSDARWGGGLWGGGR